MKTIGFLLVIFSCLIALSVSNLLRTSDFMSPPVPLGQQFLYLNPAPPRDYETMGFWVLHTPSFLVSIPFGAIKTRFNQQQGYLVDRNMFMFQRFDPVLRPRTMKITVTYQQTPQTFEGICRFSLQFATILILSYNRHCHERCEQSADFFGVVTPLTLNVQGRHFPVQSEEQMGPKGGFILLTVKIQPNQDQPQQQRAEGAVGGAQGGDGRRSPDRERGYGGHGDGGYGDRRRGGEEYDNQILGDNLLQTSDFMTPPIPLDHEFLHLEILSAQTYIRLGYWLLYTNAFLLSIPQGAIKTRFGQQQAFLVDRQLNMLQRFIPVLHPRRMRLVVQYEQPKQKIKGACLFKLKHSTIMTLNMDRRCHGRCTKSKVFYAVVNPVTLFVKSVQFPQNNTNSPVPLDGYKLFTVKIYPIEGYQDRGRGAEGGYQGERGGYGRGRGDYGRGRGDQGEKGGIQGNWRVRQNKNQDQSRGRGRGGRGGRRGRQEGYY